MAGARDVPVPGDPLHQDAQHLDFADGYLVDEGEVRSVGRPKVEIDIAEATELLFNLHLPLSQVAARLGVSRPTLYNRLSEAGLDVTERFTNISKEQLQEVVEDIKSRHPNAGASYLTGHLRSRNVHVARWRIRETLRNVDSDGVDERQTQAVARRVYSNPCPNYLWHIDGDHKLVRWKFVIHACIDGFSRMIMYLNCANNNRAETVGNLFSGATTVFGFPLRVRSDYGMENSTVWDLMKERRGLQSVILGSSVHNERVERFHRNVNEQVVSFFKPIFYEMEQAGILNPDNDTDLFCLHYVFLHRINHHLEEFRQAHNHHSVRTAENHQSPVQLFHSNQRFIIFHEQSPSDHHHPALSYEELRDSNRTQYVEVAIESPLSDAQFHELQEAIDPMIGDDPVDIYERVTGFVSNCLLA